MRLQDALVIATGDHVGLVVAGLDAWPAAAVPDREVRVYRNDLAWVQGKMDACYELVGWQILGRLEMQMRLKKP